MGDQWSIRATGKRERMMDELLELTGESTKSKALDAAMRHYIQSVNNLQEAADQLTPELARQISTDEVSLTYYPKVR